MLRQDSTRGGDGEAGERPLGICPAAPLVTYLLPCCVHHPGADLSKTTFLIHPLPPPLYSTTYIIVPRAFSGAHQRKDSLWLARYGEVKLSWFSIALSAMALPPSQLWCSSSLTVGATGSQLESCILGPMLTWELAKLSRPSVSWPPGIFGCFAVVTTVALLMWAGQGDLGNGSCPELGGRKAFLPSLGEPGSTFAQL